MKELVAIVCLASAVGCASDRYEGDREQYGLAQIEPRIASTVADETNLSSQISAWVVTNHTDLTGDWVKCAFDDGISLTLERRRNGRYDVIFRADGDLARWTLRRTGSFVEGVLKLDRPVVGYVPNSPFRYFYLVRTPIGVRLIAQPDARFWLIEKELMHRPQRFWDSMKELDFDTMIFLRKTEPNKVPEDTARKLADPQH